MIEKLLDTLKIFLEKYFIPTIIAVVLTFITYYKTPADNALLTRLTTTGFGVFVFCLWFLLIVLIIWGIDKVKGFWASIKDKKHQEALAKQENDKAIDFLWTEIDKLSLKDYKQLLEFVDNENAPITVSGIDFQQPFLNSNWFHRTEIEASKQVPISFVRNENTSSNFIPLPAYETIPAKYQYVLKDEIYELIKYSLDNYGKIGHIQR
ncbi:hypothetical protein [Holdemanella biformis]|uniref:hypothetical protein n=1 Tax=Holdemanella biformis TaxID=1735 RepID=UPI00266DC043|nr:hypothetical protein [Holdemanella biformis]